MGGLTWMLGLCRCPTLLVDCLASRPDMAERGSIDRNASITTLPLTDWIGSITTATARGFSCSNDWEAGGGQRLASWLRRC